MAYEVLTGNGALGVYDGTEPRVGLQSMNKIRNSFIDHEAAKLDHETRIDDLETGAVSTLAGLSDVTITSPASDDVLTRSGSDWVNTAPLIRRATVTLTDAQIKALPTTPVTIVAAPAAGIVLVPMRAILFSSFAAGAYTNIYAAGSLWINLSGTVSQYLVNDAGASLTLLSALLGSTTKRMANLLWPWTEEATAGGWGQVIDGLADLSVVAASAITIECDNGGSGNFTGGNAANGLKVVVLYTIESVL